MDTYTEKRNGFRIEVGIDNWADDPQNNGNYTIVQFRDNDLNTYADIDDYLTEGGKLLPSWRAKLKAGKAFAFSYSRYSNADGGFYRYPTNVVKEGIIDSRDLNGLIIFNDDYVKGVEPYEREIYAKQDLEEYTAYANGEVYESWVYEDDEAIDGGGGIYGYQEALDMARDTVDRLTPKRDSAKAQRAGELHL